MRRLPAVLAGAALVAAALAGCSSTPGSSCTGPVTSGKTSDTVTVTGTWGKKPKVSFPTPLHSPKTERSTIISGDGEWLHPNQKIDVDLMLFNGTTGRTLTATEYGKKSQASIVLNDQTLPGISEGLECARVGSRVALTIPPKDAFGKKGNVSAGVGPNDTLVAVIDVRRAYLARADGTPVPATPGFPHVVLAPDGTPGITVPKDRKPPKTLKVATLKQGHGKTVGKDDTVTVNYTGVLWKQKTVFSSTWTSHAPETVGGSTKSSAETVPNGFLKAIRGTKVGSQIIAVVPPSDGFGSKGSGSVPGDATLVYVIDILGVN